MATTETERDRAAVAGIGERRRVPLLIYGAGGFGREVLWLTRTLAMGGCIPEACGFVVDDRGDEHWMPDRLPVYNLDGAPPPGQGLHMVCAIGDPQLRREAVGRAEGKGYPFLSLIAASAELGTDVDVGRGSLICARSVVPCHTAIGEHVHINLACTVGHDCLIDSYVTLAPGVHVSGNVEIGEQAYVGSGAVIVQGKRIGVGATVGAGAVVTADVPNGVTVIGNPARVLS